MNAHQMLFYYRIMERQQAEEEVRNDFLYPPSGGKSKPLPTPRRMRELVEARLAEWHKK